jgi:hypothetical protein
MTFRYTVWRGGELMAGFCSLVDLWPYEPPLAVTVKDGERVIWDGFLTGSWEDIETMAERAAS